MTASALDKLGKHLLKRNPSPPDDRDYQLGLFLGTQDPLHAALRALRASHQVSSTVKVWARLATEAIDAAGGKPTPGPTPAPVPAINTDVMWTNAESPLDQGQTGHCVGFGGAHWGNTLPVDDNFSTEDAHSLYYACKTLDGDPLGEEGTNLRSLAKALQGRGRLKTYAFASSIHEVVEFLSTQGPVIFGTDWTRDMFSPTIDGLVTPTGGVIGGHCYLAIGYSAQRDRIRFLNSWGGGWGLNGQFEMSTIDAAAVLAANGEAVAAVELALPE